MRSIRVDGGDGLGRRSGRPMQRRSMPLMHKLRAMSVKRLVLGCVVVGVLMLAVWRMARTYAAIGGQPQFPGRVLKHERIEVVHDSIDAKRTDLYLCTQMSADKATIASLSVMYWQGPVVVVVYINSFLQIALVHESSLFHRANTKVVLYYAREPDEFYPINTLRNLAIQQVPMGSFYFLNDADFLVSQHAYKRMLRYSKTYLRPHDKWVDPDWHPDDEDAKATSPQPNAETDTDTTKKRKRRELPPVEHDDQGRAIRRAALVIPCFEYGRTSYDVESLQRTSILPTTLPEMQRAVQQGIARQSKLQYFPRGHTCTEYDRWLKGVDKEPWMQEQWDNRYEPYVVLVRDSATPMYNEDFVGWGGNKIAFTFELFARGFRYMTMPRVFIVHIPHEAKTKASQRELDRHLSNRLRYTEWRKSVKRLTGFREKSVQYPLTKYETIETLKSSTAK